MSRWHELALWKGLRCGWPVFRASADLVDVSRRGHGFRRILREASNCRGFYPPSDLGADTKSLDESGIEAVLLSHESTRLSIIRTDSRGFQGAGVQGSDLSLDPWRFNIAQSRPAGIRVQIPNP